MQLFIAGVILSYPLGACLDNVLCDDRMMNVGRVSALMDLFVDERQYIESLDLSVWTRFSKLGGWRNAADCRKSIFIALTPTC